MAEYVTREPLTGEDVRDLREILGFTQKELASFLNCSKRTVENWESGSGKVTGPAAALIGILLRWPALAGKTEIPPRKTGLRVWYYYRSRVCSVLDVDEIRRTVTVYNYTEDPLYRAFGRNTEPTFEEYEEFLESRCFPRTRDKMKLQLKEMGIPFYDPEMIIGKTEGRMAGDDFRVRMER